MILEALESAGGVAYLKQQATENPTAFLALLSKLVPRTGKLELENKLTLEQLVAAAATPDRGNQ